MTMSNHLWFLIPEAILFVGVVFTAITGLMRSSTVRRMTPESFFERYWNA